MQKYKEILRYQNAGMSQRQMSQLLDVSRGTIIKVQNAFKATGKTWEEVKAYSDIEISELLFYRPSCESMYEEPDYESMARDLAVKGVTRKLLWEEYVQSCELTNKIPYKYTRFCIGLNDFINTNKATMRFEHKPGEKIEVDWAGKTIMIINSITGLAEKAYLFVAVLPYSQYTYAEVTSDMKEENWIMAHVNAFNFFKGTTPILVSDNLKTGVTKHPKHGEIILNSSYKELADYYDLAVIPAAPLTPKGKPSVEGTVGKVTTDILARLRNKTFYSVYDANEAVKILLKDFNSRDFQKREGSRVEVYLLDELPRLKTLPKEPYEYGVWKTVTVQYNYHVSVDKMYYSVPYGYIRKKVDVRITRNMIEVFYEHVRVCSHIRLKGRIGQYSTNPEHMPPNHRAASEWNRDRFIRWAKRIGPSTETVISRMLDSYKVEQQGYNGARSILMFGDKYTPAKLENACAKALTVIETPRYKNIKLIIEHLQDSDSNEVKNSDNTGAILRGSTYYRGR